MQKNMTDRTPGSYDDFVAYLGTVRTKEELFSRLTYWFAGQNRPEDVLSRPELVEARAKELGFWQGLTFRMERWLADGKSELEAVGREEFQSRIAEDYAAYREKADAAQARFRDRRRAAPFNFTPDCLENVPIQNVSWLVEGLLPMGEVSLLGADGGTGKGIWQAQLIAYVTAGRTSGFFPQPPGKTGSVLIFSGEDDPGKVLKARLTAAGADMSRVMVVTSDAYFARTGSTGSTAEDAENCVVAEGAADHFKSVYPITEVSYGVSELTSTIRPAFTPEWFQRNGEGNISGLNRDFLINPALTLDGFLSDSLKDYCVQNNYVGFFAFESTGMSASEQAEQFDDFNSVPPVGVKLPYGPPLPTKLRVGVCHKTVAGREYCLVVVVGTC